MNKGRKPTRPKKEKKHAATKQVKEETQAKGQRSLFHT
jgi:hypothetical protein